MKNEMNVWTTSDPEWFKRWFDSSFYHQLYAHRDEKEAAYFIDGLLQKLQPPKDSAMLDLGCGAGRHANYLASKGFKVTGIDLALSSIRKALKYKTAGLQFYQHDMRMPFGNKYFDYIFNFFTSFGYFSNGDENSKVIGNISKALKPGGVIVMDYINTPYAEERLVEEEEKEIDGIAYHLSRWTDHKHFFKKITIHPIQEKPFEYVEKVAKFCLDEFEYMFSHHHLSLQEVYGDYHLNPYDITNSPRLILIAKKDQ